MSSESMSITSQRRIPPPDGAREPVKVNVFEHAAGVASELQPMFAYHGQGAIVPCTAILFGRPDGNFGHFFHMNSIEEVAVTYASNNAMLNSGSIFATQRVHGVNSFLREPTDPDAFVLVTITQHQEEEGAQDEAVIFRCGKCNAELVHFGYNASPPGSQAYDPAQWQGQQDDAIPMFATLWGSVEATEQYNQRQNRTCSGCGHVNDEHPEPVWGWKRWVDQTRVANRARRLMEEAVGDSLGSREVSQS